MARIYHSPSSCATGERCPRAWYYCYVLGLRDPKIPWAEIEAGRRVLPRQRSASLGTECHSRFQAWQEGGSLGHGLPSQICLSGVPFLPGPGDSEWFAAESAVGTGDVALSPRDDPDAPKWAWDLFGIRWVGFVDLAAELGAAEAERIALPAGVPIVFDYKSTSSIQKWAKTPEILRVDLARCLYSAWASRQTGIDPIPCRWLYLETGKTRRALPVDVTAPNDVALRVIEQAADLARQLDTITDEQSAEQRERACGDYGGCQYHSNAGGPCRVRRSIGALVTARGRKRDNMALTEEQKAKFSGLTTGKAPPPKAQPTPAAAALAEPAAAEAQPEPSPAPAAAAPAPAPAPATRKPRATKQATAPAGGLAEAIGALQAELAEAEGLRTQADAAVREALGKIAALATEAAG